MDTVLDEARACLHRLGVSDTVDDADALRDTTNVQLCLTIAGIACARALTDDHGISPRFVAGHSVGGFAAAAAAGVITVGEALHAVHRRAELMKEACAQGDWGMAAVSGLPTAAVRDLVETARSDVWVANVNSATQTVLSGSAPALSAVKKGAAAADFELLDVAVASHCPLQAGTAEQMVAHLASVPRRQPKARFLTDVGGRAVATAGAILDDLARAVAEPVQWYQASRLMPELGVTCAIEMHPGHVLTRLNSANAPGVLSLSLQDNGIEAVARRASASPA